MAHAHHHHVPRDAGDRRLIAAIGVNVALTLAQIVGGLLSGSLALIADALHTFSDAISLIIAFGARRIAQRPRDARMTFGYDRVEIVAALVNYTTLVLIGLYLIYEAILRFLDPQPVTGWLVIAVAGFALLVDIATAVLTYRMSKESVNIRAAFLHNVADALGSVAVIVAGVLILAFGWWIVDPVATALIAGYILWQAVAEIRPVIRILMLGSPPDVETDVVLSAIEAVEGVTDVHHARFWQFDEHHAEFDAHITVDKGRWSQADGIKAAIKSMLAKRFGIQHTTLEIECSVHACDTPSRLGQ